jgi:long-chain acyl-CoA synthetase
MGEIVVAYIVAAAKGVDLDEHLDRHCLQNLARFKRPKHYRLALDLPKNAYGKVGQATLAGMGTEQVR